MQSCYDYLKNNCHTYPNKKQNTMDSLMQYYGLSSKNSPVNNPVNKVPASVKPLSNNNDLIVVKSVGKIELVPHDEIYCLHTSSNYIEIHLENRKILHRESLSKLETKLDENTFIRVHRSSIVNLKRIKHIESEQNRYNMITLLNGLSIKLSNAYRMTLFNQLGIESC